MSHKLVSVLFVTLAALCTLIINIPGVLACARIDIKPGSFPNSINCNNENEVVTVAILTTPVFDATTVDHTTVVFGPNRATETHVKDGVPTRHEEDVDGDGDTDLVLHFKLSETGIQCGDTLARLRAMTFDGQEIVGKNSIRTVGDNANPAPPLRLVNKLAMKWARLKAR
jgi:hypothetical protein